MEKVGAGVFTLQMIIRRLAVLLGGLAALIAGFIISGIIDIEDITVVHIFGHFIAIVGSVVTVEVIAHSFHSAFIYSRFDKNVQSAKSEILDKMRSDFDIQKIVEESVNASFEENFINITNAKNSGIVSVGKNLDTLNYLNDIEDATEEIRILQTYLHDDHTLTNALNHIKDRNKVRIKILLTHPKSIYALIRSNELGHSLGSLGFVSEKIMNNLDLLSAYKNENFEVRLYTGSASLSMYAADDIINLGFFWRKNSCTTSSVLRLKSHKGQKNDHNNNHFTFYAESHFEFIYDKSERVDFNDVDWRKKIMPDPEEQKIMAKYILEYPPKYFSEDKK